jgi:DNA-binding GntR family transcriptional regulator
MSRHKSEERLKGGTLGPLPENLQMGARVYQVLRDIVVSGQIETGAPLRPDVLARQLVVSTTPVREALHRLESDGLAVKVPNQGWFVREFTNQQIRELYEFRVALESLAVRLACERITEAEIAWLRNHQLVGEAALSAGDSDAYRAYNQGVHAAIVMAARNSYLTSVTEQLRLQTEMSSARTIRMEGRPQRGLEEHGRLIEQIAARNAAAAEQLIRDHILNALADYVRLDVARPAIRESKTRGQEPLWNPDSAGESRTAGPKEPWSS